MQPGALPGPPYPNPATRRLRIYAVDPLLKMEDHRGRLAGSVATVAIPFEEDLLPGPIGSRIEVIDYDGHAKCFYPSVDLDHPRLLMTDGLEPSEADPRFHQQMVYAVTMRVIGQFERALGLRFVDFRFAKNRRLRIFPHAFRGANAYYDPAFHAILYGYFEADRDVPGPYVPGQTVFTCLSHDIIAHETTHAMLHRLRRRFLDSSNPDVLAFHEGFSDLIAIFMHFSYPEVVQQELRHTRLNLRSANLLADIARQFGYALGTGVALRSAIGMTPDPALFQKATEPHDRGAILVAAIFQAFVETYERRVRPTLQLATAGSGVLPQGDLNPLLVEQVAADVAKTASHFLGMCIRACDYLPPVDPTFGDYLRALITLDRATVPDDGAGQRAATIEAFRQWGIYPEGVTSLAEEALSWPTVPNDAYFPPIEKSCVETLLLRRTGLGEHERAEGASDVLGAYFRDYADTNRALLGLAPGIGVNALGFHSVYRVAPDGNLTIEHVVQFEQTQSTDDPALGGNRLRGGCTLIANVDGSIRHVIAKPMTADAPDFACTGLRGPERYARQVAHVLAEDLRDPAVAVASDKEFSRRAVRRASFRAVHQGRR